MELTLKNLLPIFGYNVIQNRSQQNFPCPVCESGKDGKGHHLNVNYQKDVFCCPLCHFKGGIIDFLGFYLNCSPKESIKKFRQEYPNLCGNERFDFDIAKKQQELSASIREFPVNGIEERNHTYEGLLNLLTLADDHRQNLISRGLTNEEIEMLGYRTSPVIGHSKIANDLLMSGHYLSGVPGFYHNDNNAWTFVKSNRGILIPVRDYEGRIQGIQIRLDSTEKRKFRWVSSASFNDGSGASVWCHYRKGNIHEDTVIITEGPMKADIINLLSGMSVIGVPGVGSLKHLPALLDKVIANGVKKVKIAYDMDYLYNPNVQEGYSELKRILSGKGVHYTTLVWNPFYKGLDDYIQGRSKK